MHDKCREGGSDAERGLKKEKCNRQKKGKSRSLDGELSRRGERLHGKLGSRGSAPNSTPLDSSQRLIHLMVAYVKSHSQGRMPPLAPVKAFNVRHPFTRPPIHPRLRTNIQYTKAHSQNERGRGGKREMESVKMHTFIELGVSHSTRLYVLMCTSHSYIRQNSPYASALLLQRKKKGVSP